MAADPTFPPIPKPVADLNGLTFVVNALKQRVDNIAVYVTTLNGTVAAVSNASSVSYTLPVASASVLGGVKIDGTTVTITAGVISVLSSPDTALPSMVLPGVDGVAAIGVATTYARADHIHPTDTSRYAASNPDGFITTSELSYDLLVAALQTQARIWFAT